MITEPELLAAAADILIVNDLLDEVIRDADSHTVDQAVVMRATIAEVIKKAKEAIAALDVHLTSEMELYEPIHFKGISYVVKRKKEQVRFDHGKIAGHVQREAIKRVADRHGEIIPSSVARMAVDIMRRLYLSDSSTPKIGELKRLGIERSDVETKTLGDKYVDCIPLQAGDQSARDS